MGRWGGGEFFWKGREREGEVFSNQWQKESTKKTPKFTCVSWREGWGGGLFALCWDPHLQMDVVELRAGWGLGYRVLAHWGERVFFIFI